MENKSFSSLTKSSDFENLKKRGKKASPSGWLLCVYKSNDLDRFRLGLTISRKIGSAVVRNKLKRWCREFFRKKTKSDQLGIDINIIFRPQEDEFYKKISHSVLDEKLEKLWSDLRKNA